jgi:endonuclease/exonuclease/phosphatase family metal-dependent hydrolase
MEISILQWNAWYKEKPTSIINFLKEVDADVLCLQELTQTSEYNPGINIPELIESELALQPAFFVAQTWASGGEVLRDQGNAIFSKYPIRDKRKFAIQDFVYDDPNFDEEGRDYIEADIDINGMLLTVGTTHMSYTDRFAGSLRRSTEDSKLIEYIGYDRTNFYFSGDLNATPKSQIINNIPRQTNLRIASPPYDENTWTTKPFSYQGFNVDTLKYRLDYAFASHDIRILSTKILQTTVSDHLPILTVIKI